MKYKFQNKGKETGYMEIKNSSDTIAELTIFGDISAEKWWGDEVTPTEVKELLDSAEGRDLKIYINSPGGDAFAGVAIHNMLSRYSGKKEVFIEGLAASAASIIAMAGDIINIPKNAFLMIHRAATITYGNINDIKETLNRLEKIDNTIAETYTLHSANDTTKEKFLELMDAETWLNGTEAKEYFNVNVTESIKMVASCNDSDIWEKYKCLPNDIKNSIENSKSEKLIKDKKELEIENEKLKLLAII